MTTRRYMIAANFTRLPYEKTALERITLEGLRDNLRVYSDDGMTLLATLQQGETKTFQARRNANQHATPVASSERSTDATTQSPDCDINCCYSWYLDLET